MLIAALLLILAGCSSGVGGPRASSENYIEPPPAVGPPSVRPGPAPLGVGLPGVGRVTAPPRRHCKIKEKTVVQTGRKRVTRYQVCK